MEYNSDIVKLVIKNASLIEDAQEILWQADENFVKRIWRYIAGFSRKDASFAVGTARNGDKFLWAKSWAGKDGSPVASFWLDGQGKGLEDNTWFSVLCGLIPGTSAGLYFWYEWDNEGLSKKEWKARLKDFFTGNPSLCESGFYLNDSGTAIVKPLSFDLDCIAENFNELDICFERLAEALRDIFAHADLFTDLITGVKQARRH